MKTKVIVFDPAAPADGVTGEAVRAIRAGGLVVFPTETVYGLGGDGGRVEVVNRIYELKGRRWDKPLVRLIADLKEVENLFKKTAHRRLAETFWPGPLTLILEQPDGVRQGFRVPVCLFARKLAAECGVPLVATSANPSGGPEVVSGEEARRLFSGAVDLIVDGGTLAGTASTVLDLTVSPEKILRPGPITQKQIERFCVDFRRKM